MGMFIGTVVFAIFAVLFGVFFRTEGPPFPSRGSIDLQPVRTVQEKDLSVDDFIEQYVKQEEPVIIKLNKPPKVDLQLMSQLCEFRHTSCVSPATREGILGLSPFVKRMISMAFRLFGHSISLDEELRMRGNRWLKLPTYIEYLTNETSRCPDGGFKIPYIFRFLPLQARLVYELILRPLYMHDLPLSKVCKYVNDYTNLESSLPIYLEANSIAEFPHDRAEQEAQNNPFIFAGPCASSSYPLHLNIFPADVIMIMTEGEKTFSAFHSSQREFLAPTPLGIVDMFDANALRPDLFRTPGLVKARGYRGKITAGHMLFLPGTWIHQFENTANGPSVGLKYWYYHAGSN